MLVGGNKREDEQYQAQITDLMSNSQNSDNKLKVEIDKIKGEVDTTEKMRLKMLTQQKDEY